MHCEAVVLAQYSGFGSVFRCTHGFVHVQLGLTTLTLTEERYQRLVAMLTDSAANFELQRQGFTAMDGAEPDSAGPESPEANFPGFP